MCASNDVSVVRFGANDAEWQELQATGLTTLKGKFCYYGIRIGERATIDGPFPQTANVRITSIDPPMPEQNPGCSWKTDVTVTLIT